VQQKHQAGALAELVPDRTAWDELLTLDHKRCGEIRAIGGERSRHDGHPFQHDDLLVSPIALPLTTKPRSANP
jgi:hypothetical protein